MPETWHDFYVMTGLSAAVLIGLLFVVVTLTANYNRAVTLPAARIYVTPTLFHFASIAVVSAVSLIPAGRAGLIGIVLIGCGVGGLAYAAMVTLALSGRHRPDIMHWTDPVFYALLPALVYLGLLASGIAFLEKVLNAPYYAAAALIVLLLLGVRDTWDVTLWSAHHPEQPPPAQG